MDIEYNEYKFWATDIKMMFQSHEIGVIDLFGGRVSIGSKWYFFDKERYGDKVNCILLRKVGIPNDIDNSIIYENDILRFKDNLSERIIVIEWINKIRYLTGYKKNCPYSGWVGRYYGTNWNQTISLPKLLQKYDSYEHIGNIFQTPELVNK